MVTPIAAGARTICIVAAKDLRRNTRVARQAASLRAHGWRVTVAALEKPAADDLGDVRCVAVPLPHPLRALEARMRGSRPPVQNPGMFGTARTAPARQPRGTRCLTILRAVAMPFGSIMNSVLFARACRTVLNGDRFDIVQAHDAQALRAAYRLARRDRAVLVYDAVEFVDSRPTHLRGHVARWVRRWESACEARLVKKARLTFAIGPGLRDWMASRYSIPSPVVVRNCRNYEPARREAFLRQNIHAPPNARLVLYANTIHPGRGIEQMLEALQLLSANVHLVILGDAGTCPYAQEIKVLATQLGVCERLHFVPPVPPGDVVRVSSGADIGVIPFLNTNMNHYYALPNRIFEMVMARLPIAASAFPDMRNLIAEFAIGDTFDPTRPASIAACVQRLLDCEARSRLSDNLESAARALSWKHESREYLAALDRLLPPPE